MAMLSREKIQELGFASVGKDVQISELASFHGNERIILGDNVRVDDFCVLSAGVGGIVLGDNIHLAVACSLIGSGKITLKDFCNLSSRVAIYSSNDDYSGEAMSNPTVPSEFTRVTHAPVVLGKHVIIGSGSVILPGVVLEEGVAIGALSLVNKSCAEFGVYAGVPARRIRDRKRNLIELEAKLLLSRLKK
jgi:acetyltransferase-like isoleucine patch superfamily enzyme